MKVRLGHRGDRAAFSLVEIALSLAIFATVGLALIGLLGSALNVSRGALSDAEVTMLIENLQARLTLDPAWPPRGEPLLFDNSGAQMIAETTSVFRVTLTRTPGPGFASDYLDTYRAAIERADTKQPIGTWTLQRARLANGKAVKAP